MSSRSCMRVPIKTKSHCWVRSVASPWRFTLPRGPTGKQDTNPKTPRIRCANTPLFAAFAADSSSTGILPNAVARIERRSPPTPQCLVRLTGPTTNSAKPHALGRPRLGNRCNTVHVAFLLPPNTHHQSVPAAPTLAAWYPTFHQHAHTADARPKVTDTAYYYPAPYWNMQETSWIKSLLLFFDDIATLLPDYMYGRHVHADPVLAAPLEERGLLRVLEPKDWIDEETTNQLANIVVELLTNGAFDNLPKTEYAELSQSRMGYGADLNLATYLVEELQNKGLARPSEDGVSIPLHPTVRTTILVILGQLSRSVGHKRGLTIHPTTNYHPAVSDLIQTLSMDTMPSRQNVVQLDLEPVAFDLSSIPLDDVLQFRAEHQNAHRTYMRDLRRFMIELAEVEEPSDRTTLLLERRQEISDAAHDIQRTTRRTLQKDLASWSLGIAGGVWSFSTGDPIGIVLAAIGFIPGFVSGGTEKVGAYSYIFDIGTTFRGKSIRY